MYSELALESTAIQCSKPKVITPDAIQAAIEVIVTEQCLLKAKDYRIIGLSLTMLYPPGVDWAQQNC
jgi:hypothetical protein